MLRRKRLWIIVSILSVVCISSAVYASTFKENKEEITALSEPDETDERDEIEVEETEKAESESEKEVNAESSKTQAEVSVNSNNENKEQPVVKAENNPKKEPEKKQPVKQKAASEKKAASTSLVYKSNKLGIQLSFPSNWQDKYTVTETDKGIIISYIFQHDYYYNYYGEKYSRGDCKTRYLVSIEDVSLLNEEDLAFIDKINNVPRFKMIHGKKYVIGGPADCLESGDPDKAEVEQFITDLPNIINSIKEI